MNQKEYLNRIHYRGALEPSLEVLQNLQQAHLLSVPFENLDIHTSHKIKLDISLIYQKIVGGNRGGFCYELNGLFFELLQSIGFGVKMVSARVHKGDDEYGDEFDHMALIVKIGETEYLADVGFGEFTMKPLKLIQGIIQKDERGEFVIDQNDQYLRVNKVENGEKNPEYIFTIVPRSLDEYAGMCTFHQTSPDSHFTQKRLISKPTKKGRITLIGDTLKIKKQSSTQEITIKNENDFAEVLFKYFGVKLP